MQIHMYWPGKDVHENVCNVQINAPQKRANPSVKHSGFGVIFDFGNTGVYQIHLFGVFIRIKNLNDAVISVFDSRPWRLLTLRGWEYQNTKGGV